MHAHARACAHARVRTHTHTHTPSAGHELIPLAIDLNLESSAEAWQRVILCPNSRSGKFKRIDQESEFKNNYSDMSVMVGLTVTVRNTDGGN